MPAGEKINTGVGLPTIGLEAQRQSPVEVCPLGIRASFGGGETGSPFLCRMAAPSKSAMNSRRMGGVDLS